MAVLGTKIHVPVPRRDLVPLAQLAQELVSADSPRLVFVSAPAGFAKTTLLSQWLATGDRDRRVAWFSLDEADNDPHRFLEHLVAAVQVVADVPEAAQLVAAGSQVPADTVLTSLVNDLGVTLISLRPVDPTGGATRGNGTIPRVRADHAVEIAGGRR